MVQAANILAQRLFVNLLPSNFKSLLFFKIYFCYKILFESFLFNFFKMLNLSLISFYLGFSKSSFFINFFLLKLIKGRKLKSHQTYSHSKNFLKKKKKYISKFLSFKKKKIKKIISIKLKMIKKKKKKNL